MTQTTHLVQLDDKGSNGGRPTRCGLTRFDRHENGHPVLHTADLPGWCMGGSGITGPHVQQIKCPDCYQLADTGAPVETGSVVDGRTQLHGSVDA